MVGAPEPWAGEEDLNFIKTSVKDEKIARQRPKGGSPPDEIEFDPSEADEEWGHEKVRTQIGKTVKAMERKTLRTGDEIFFILDLKFEPSYHKVRDILKRLDATILAYLNETHSKMLVSASNDKLNKLYYGKKIPKYIDESLHVIRPRLVSEQLGEDLKTAPADERKLLLFKLMPNIPSAKNNAYMTKLENYLRQQDSHVYESDLKKVGIVAADANIATAQSVADTSTFVYDISAAPAGLAEQIRRRKTKTKKSKKSEPVVIGTALSLDGAKAGNESNAPTVVVMDTGADEIPHLNDIVIARDGHHSFATFDDGYRTGEGHGTPICYLIAHGERQLRIPVKIISYKIFSLDKGDVCYEGMLNAIDKYGEQSRLFSSSIGFEECPESLVVELDKKVQAANICLVCAAGNIQKSKILTHITTSKPYPKYLKDYKIFHPSTGVNIMCVGALAKKNIPKASNSYSIAPISALSPHSRCGHDNPLLFNCRKPEVVEHGGNLNFMSGALSEKGVGVTGVNYKGIETDSLVGTSFAAPLFTRKLAMIESKWGHKIKNSETLKAIALMSCVRVEGFAGFGEATLVTGTDRNHSLFVTEGELPLEDRTDKDFKTVYHGVTKKMWVPAGIKQIDVCIVHSDNVVKKVAPMLSTYLNVEMKKSGSDSVVPASAGNTQEMTNIKFLTYRFTRQSMEADWWLNLTPQPTAPMLVEEMKDAKVRFGCAILLSRKHDYQHVLSVNQQIESE